MSACLLFACLSIAWAQSPRVNPFANDADAAEAGRAQFRLRCAPCHGFKGEGGRGPDLTLGVYNAGNTDEDGTVLAVDPARAQALAVRLSEALTHDDLAQPVLLCSPTLRPHLWRLFSRALPHIAVLSHAEVPAQVRIVSVATLD